MVAHLPDDLLHEVCAVLWEQRDFDTLFHCACAGKQLAYPALANLYRMHEMAPVTGAGNDELELPKLDPMSKATFQASQDNQERITMKWASMWRSIMLSGLGRTYYPYSNFIRALHLQDLHDLLSDDKLRISRVSASLFKGDMAKYRVDRTLQVAKKRNLVLIDAEATVNNFAEVITQNAPLLEEFRGNQQLSSSILINSLPHLSHLQTLIVFRGEVLEGIGPLLRDHCPFFNTLRFYGWQQPEADNHLATLLNQLRPNTLQSFEILSTSNIGAESFLALNCHQESLKELKLNDIKSEASANISLLRECTNLHTLLIAENGPDLVDLEAIHKEAFQEVIAWLRECTDLRSLTIRNFVSGPSILKYLLIERDIKLTRLEVENYQMSESREFHQALSHQPSLQHLSLRGESSDAPDDNDVLVDALCKLENLTELRFRDVSDAFLNCHLISLASNLPKLEILWTSGYGITDDIWESLASLTHLRALEFNALTRFTVTGILGFIERLSAETNKGLGLQVMMQENDCDIAPTDLSLILSTIESKLEGRFQFMLWRDPDAESYSVASD